MGSISLSGLGNLKYHPGHIRVKSIQLYRSLSGCAVAGISKARDTCLAYLQSTSILQNRIFVHAGIFQNFMQVLEYAVFY